MKKIIITDNVDKKAVALLKDAGFEVNYTPGMKPDDIYKIIGDYHGMIVRSDTKVNAEMISYMKNMEVIGRAGTGVDNIDSAAATRKGVIVMNTPGGNTISTAEHTFSMMMSLCRNIPQADASVKGGKWDRKSYKGTEVHGKTLGVVGLGKIGREVALRAQAFGMQIIGYDPLLSQDLAAKMNVELTTLDEIYKRSDIITVHVPLDATTKDLLRKETFALCKDGVKIINCARGGIVNEDDLLEALNSGKVSGAAMDVFVKEPPDFSHPLLKHSKFVSTPHLGASTDEAQEKVAIQIAEQIIDLFKKKIVFGAVNGAAVEAAGKPELVPYVKLAESMGALQSQLLTAQVKSLRVNLFGDLLNNSVSLITAAVLKGFLNSRIPEPVNYINAGYFAKEMGLQIEEVKSSDHPDYINLISVECTTSADKRKLDGVVFGNNEIRIVNIDEFHLELNPEGPMLFYTNIDRPGMLAKVGSILAENDINIAGLSLGRFGIGKEALTVINLDSAMDKMILDKISSIDGVSKVFSVKI